MTRMAHACMPLDTHKLNYARRLLDTLPHDVACIADNFYPDANGIAREWARLSGYSIEQCCAVLALYSINAGWCANCTLARNALLHGRIVGIPVARENVRAILSGASLRLHLTRGLKINAFYRAISGDMSACVVDRWMYRIFDKPQSKTWYLWVSHCVKLLARDSALTVCTTQSRLWYAVILDHARQGDRGAMQSARMLGISEYIWIGESSHTNCGARFAMPRLTDSY